MTDAKYVLCRWEKRLWPAKVLARTETSAKNKRKKEFFLDVQILSLKEKIQVKSSAVEALQKSHIENIAAFLASQNEVPATPLEELTYRRSLRVALDVLNERTSLSPESHPVENGSTPSQKGKPDADVAWQVSSAPSPSFLSEDDQAAAAQCASKRRWECSPKSLSPLSASEEDLRCKVDPKTGLSESGALGAEVPAPTGDESQDGSGSQLDHGQESTTKKRQRNSGEKPARRGKAESGLSKGDSVAGIGGQASSCVALASPRLPSQTWEGDPCAGVEGCDPVESSGNIRPLLDSERSKGRPTKRPRLDGGRNPPPRHLGTRTVGAVPSRRSCSGEVMTLRRAGDSDRPEEDPMSSEESTGFKSVLLLLSSPLLSATAPAS